MNEVELKRKGIGVGRIGDIVIFRDAVTLLTKWGDDEFLFVNLKTGRVYKAVKDRDDKGYVDLVKVGAVGVLHDVKIIIKGRDESEKEGY